MNEHRLDAIPAEASIVVFVFIVPTVLSFRLDEEILSSLLVGAEDLDHKVVEASDAVCFVQFRNWTEVVTKPVDNDRAPGENAEKQGEEEYSH